MEEDLKVLEEFIEQYNTDEDLFCFINYSTIQAIENLIKIYRELEKKNKRYEKYLRNKDIEHEKVLEYIETEKEQDYIPKSKVRELQDKYKNKIEKLESKKIWNEPVDTIYKNRYTNYFNAYEELLQEGDK